MNKEDEFVFGVFSVGVSVLLWLNANITEIFPDQKIDNKADIVEEIIEKTEFQKMCEKTPGLKDRYVVEFRKTVKPITEVFRYIAGESDSEWHLSMDDNQKLLKGRG